MCVMSWGWDGSMKSITSKKQLQITSKKPSQGKSEKGLLCERGAHVVWRVLPGGESARVKLSLPVDHSLSSSPPSIADDIPLHPGRPVDLFSSASQPHHQHHHLLLPPLNTTTRQPSPPHIHPLKLLPKPSYLTGTNSPPSYTAPARLWQPAYSASGLLHPTPHRRTPRSCPPASTQQPDILVRPRPSADFVLLTPSPPFPCSVAHGHAALTSASRLLAYHPAHPTQLGRRSRI
ncbi:hypothetical protein Q7P35_004552 [Cladosporium inversicolor]